MISRFRPWWSLSASLLVLLVLQACSVEEPPAALLVTVEPDRVTLFEGQSRPFEAHVSGDDVVDDAVTWSVRGGAPDDTITSDGLFTAGDVAPGEDERTVEVVATSLQDGVSEGVALVTIEPMDPDAQGVDPVIRSFADDGNVAPSVVRFDASDSSSQTGEIVSFTWAVDGVLQDEGDPILDVYFATSGGHTVTLTIEDENGNTASEQVTVDIGAAASPYTIDIRFFDDEDMTLSQRRAFSAAARRWAEVIQSDFEPFSYSRAAGSCGVPEAFDGTIDDILIYASIADIDGNDGVLAQAGPCDVDQDLFPLYGVMQFDIADLDVLEGNADLEGVILHEMGHVLGFGTLWEVEDRGLMDPPDCIGASDPRFVGANAVREWQSYGGSGAVPVQDGAVPDGTACGHWREMTADQDLFNELMTGFLDASMDLSRFTIGSLEDLGYAVNYAAADPFDLFPAITSRGEGEEGERVRLEEVLILPDLSDPHPVRR